MSFMAFTRGFLNQANAMADQNELRREERVRMRLAAIADADKERKAEEKKYRELDRQADLVSRSGSVDKATAFNLLRSGLTPQEIIREWAPIRTNTSANTDPSPMNPQETPQDGSTMPSEQSQVQPQQGPDLLATPDPRGATNALPSAATPAAAPQSFARKFESALFGPRPDENVDKIAERRAADLGITPERIRELNTPLEDPALPAGTNLQYNPFTAEKLVKEDWFRNLPQSPDGRYSVEDIIAAQRKTAAEDQQNKLNYATAATGDRNQTSDVMRGADMTAIMGVATKSGIFGQMQLINGQYQLASNASPEVVRRYTDYFKWANHFWTTTPKEQRDPNLIGALALEKVTAGESPPAVGATSTGAPNPETTSSPDTVVHEGKTYYRTERTTLTGKPVYKADDGSMISPMGP